MPSPLPKTLARCIVLLVCSLSISACSSAPEPKKDSALIDTTASASVQDTEATRKQETDSLIRAANAAVITKAWPRAIKAYDQAIALNPQSWEFLVDKAILQAKTADFPGAIESMRQAMRQGADKNAKAWVELGNIYQNRGMYHEAIRAYRVALGLEEQGRPETLLNLSSAYIFISKFQDANDTLNYVLQKSPNDPRALHNQALIAQLQKDHAAAVQMYDALLLKHPNFAQSHYNRGHVLMLMNQYEDAIGSFSRYVELEPDGPYANRAKNMVTSLTQRMHESR